MGLIVQGNEEASDCGHREGESVETSPLEIFAGSLGYELFQKIVFIFRWF
jgi:hypothetical protein